MSIFSFQLDKGQVALGTLMAALIALIVGLFVFIPRNQLPSPEPTPEPSSCICSEIYDPVCGVDGKTYSNDCRAKCVNATVAYRSACAATVNLPAPVLGASNPVQCAADYAACNKYACRFTGGVCDTAEQKTCTAQNAACLAKLPPVCVSAYNQCIAQTFPSTRPCPNTGRPKLKTQAECLSEYSTCAKNPPVATGACATAAKNVCFAGAIAEDTIVTNCGDNTFIYQKSDGTQYHGTMNRCR